MHDTNIYSKISIYRYIYLERERKNTRRDESSNSIWGLQTAKLNHIHRVLRTAQQPVYQLWRGSAGCWLCLSDFCPIWIRRSGWWVLKCHKPLAGVSLLLSQMSLVLSVCGILLLHCVGQGHAASLGPSSARWMRGSVDEKAQQKNNTKKGKKRWKQSVFYQIYRIVFF